MNRGLSIGERKTIFVLFILSSLLWGLEGCREDWSARIGIYPLVQSLSQPFEAYSFEVLQQKLSLNPPRFAFVLVGNTDIQPGKRENQNSIYRKLLDVCCAINPRPSFLFHLGDIAAASGDRDAWMEFLSASRPFVLPSTSDCTAPESTTFLLTVPGDLDVRDKISQGAYLETFSCGDRRTYYSFNFKGVHFVVLDSEMVDEGLLSRYFGWNRYQDRVSGGQLEWLQEDLTRAAGMPVFIMVHKPVFPPSYARHEGYCLDRHYFDRERLVGLFKEYSVRGVFSGHEPICYCTAIEGTHYLISGGGGRPAYTIERLGGFHHFLYVAFYDDSAGVCYAVDSNGSVRLEVALEH